MHCNWSFKTAKILFSRMAKCVELRDISFKAATAKDSSASWENELENCTFFSPMPRDLVRPVIYCRRHSKTPCRLLLFHSSCVLIMTGSLMNLLTQKGSLGPKKFDNPCSSGPTAIQPVSQKSRQSASNQDSQPAIQPVSPEGRRGWMCLSLSTEHSHHAPEQAAVMSMLTDVANWVCSITGAEVRNKHTGRFVQC